MNDSVKDTWCSNDEAYLISSLKKHALFIRRMPRMASFIDKTCLVDKAFLINKAHASYGKPY